MKTFKRNVCHGGGPAGLLGSCREQQDFVCVEHHAGPDRVAHTGQSDAPLVQNYLRLRVCAQSLEGICEFTRVCVVGALARGLLFLRAPLPGEGSS